jgi:hypothetical protein
VARFVGQLDFAPQDPARPDEWKLEQDFGFVRDDGLMIIAQAGEHTDGASIPRFLWRVLGHPFHKGNRFWAIPHDAGYHGCAVIIDLIAAQITPEYALDNWRTPVVDSFVHAADLDRKWWDESLQMAMVAKGECAVKRKTVCAAVRMFGWRAYRKNRG